MGGMISGCGLIPPFGDLGARVEEVIGGKSGSGRSGSLKSENWEAMAFKFY